MGSLAEDSADSSSFAAVKRPFAPTFVEDLVAIGIGQAFVVATVRAFVAGILT